MSAFDHRPVPCPACGAACALVVPEAANVARDPAYREQVLAGNFMRFACAGCGTPFVLERDLLYTDLDRGLFVVVYPRGFEARRAELVALAEQVFERAILGGERDPARALFAHVRPRLVFGYEQLREKVVCAEHGLDDRRVELLKRALRRDIPGYDDSGIEGLSLQHVWPDRLVFRPWGGPGDVATERHIEVGREAYDDLAVPEDAVACTSLLAAIFPDAYVNCDRLTA